MRKVNEALKELRVGKNMSLADATRGVCTATALSNYESGDTKDIQFGNLRGILANMRVSMSEFEYVLNGYQGSYYFELSKKVSDLYQQRNVLVLNDLREELEKKATSKHDQIFCLMIKRLLSHLDSSVKLSKEEIFFIDDFFSRFDHWGYFEISLYNNLLDTFSPNFVVEVSNKLANDSLFYEHIPENKTLIITCLLNTVSTLIRHDYYTDARLFLKRLKPLLDENHLLQKNQWHFLFGNLNVALDYKKGYEIMKESIEVFRLLNCTNELERHLAGYKVIKDYYSKNK